jgi:hypothetical protein
VKSTWIKAIKNGNFSSLPGLNEQNVEKYLTKSTSTSKGHLNQQQQNARTTKIKDAEKIDSEPDPDHGLKTQYILLNSRSPNRARAHTHRHVRAL